VKQLFKTPIVAPRFLIAASLSFACLATLIIGGGTFASKKTPVVSNSSLGSDVAAVKAGLPVAASTPPNVQPLAGTLDGQLWFVVQGAINDIIDGHVNSDGSNITTTFLNIPATPGTGFQQGGTDLSIGVDLPDGLYFVANSDGLSITVQSITTGAQIDTLQIANFNGSTAAQEIVNSLVVDPNNHFVYAGIWGNTLAESGVIRISYNVSNVGLFGDLQDSQAYNSGSQTMFVNGSQTGNLTDLRYMDLSNNNLTLYVTDDINTSFPGFSSKNGIYKVDLTNPGAGATLLSSQAQFPINLSNGLIGSLTADEEDGIIYFTTHQFNAGGASTAQDALWWIPINSPGTLATKITLPAGALHYAGEWGGLSYDRQTGQLYISDEDPTANTVPNPTVGRHIIQLQMSADGKSVTSTVNTHTVDQLVGHTADPNAYPLGTMFDLLPIITVTGTATHAAEQGATLDLTGAVSTSATDADNNFLASATVQITGGTFVSNETSANDDHLSVNDGGVFKISGTFTGTSITITNDSATEKLTLSGVDTLAHYQTVLNAVSYNTTGDNPTNYGNATTRTITWTLSDGAPNVPDGGQNQTTTTLTIDAVDDPPVNTVPGAQSVMEGSNLSVTTLHVTDPDADPANQNVTVTLSVLHGKVTVATNVASGLVVGDVTNNGTASVSINATQNKINTTFAAANSVLYKSGLYQGPETLTMLSNDQNHTGSGGPLTDSDGVGITVTAPQVDYAEASPGTCGGNDPCYPSVQSAITDVLNDGTGITNVFGGVFNESVTVNKNATTTLNINGATTINDFTLTAGTLKGNSSILTILGNWSKNGGTFMPGTGTVTFAGNGNTQTLSGNTSFGNLTINHTGLNNVTASGSTLAVTGLLEVQSGTFISSSTFNNVQIDNGATLAGTNGTTMNVSGNWTNNGGSATSFTANSNAVNFNGSGAQTIGGSTSTAFGTLTINSSNTVSLAIATTSDNLNVNGGVLDLLTFTFNWTTLSGGNFTVGNGATLKIGGTNTLPNFPAKTIGLTSTVEYSGTNQSVAAVPSQYGNLIISGSGTKTLAASISVGFLTISGGALDVSGSNFNVGIGGDWTNNVGPGGFVPRAGTVTFLGGGSSQSIKGSASSQTFNNLTINTSSSTTVSAGGSTTSLTLNGNFLLSFGTFSVGTATTINVAGNWTKSISAIDFTAGSSTVNLNGSSTQTIGGTGATTFNNLTNSNAAGIAMNGDNTVNGLLALTSSDITVASGKTLTQPLSSTTSGGADVVGNLTRTNGGVQFPSGSPITFGNPNTLLNFTAAGTRPTAINFRLTETAPTDAATGGTNTGFPGAVKRTWLITPTGGSGFSATMQLHYLVGDLNGNVETNTGPGSSVSLRLYKYVINSPGTGWQQQDFPNFNNTTIDTSFAGSHFVKLVGVTGFSPWTIGGVSPTATNSTVSGRITDDAGNPVEGAVIRLNGTQDRKTITDSQGNYTFAEVETNGFYTVTPSRVNYNFAPATRGFSALGAHPEASFGAAFNGNHLNPLDTTEYFVRQQYVDFLGREPEEKGFNDWTDTINNCASGDASCDRVHVSEMFFRSEEFQQRGYFVYRFYSTAFGQKPDYAAFAPDLGRVSGFLDATQLEAAKTQFANDFVNRPAFAPYATMTNAQYVDALAQTAGVTLSNRQALVSSLEAGTLTRAQALRQIAESGEVYAKYYNQAFVVMEYFGYLRRDPDILYLNWISVLDANPADSRHMVEGFVDATEYRNRFKQ
jgi:hypothetical protein